MHASCHTGCKEAQRVRAHTETHTHTHRMHVRDHTAGTTRRPPRDLVRQIVLAHTPRIPLRQKNTRKPLLDTGRASAQKRPALRSTARGRKSSRGRRGRLVSKEGPGALATVAKFPHLHVRRGSNTPAIDASRTCPCGGPPARRAFCPHPRDTEGPASSECCCFCANPPPHRTAEEEGVGNGGRRRLE